MSDFDVQAGAQKYAVSVHGSGDQLRVSIDGRVYSVALDTWIEPTHFVLTVDGAATPVVIERVAEGLRVTLGSDQHQIQINPRVPIPRRGAADTSAATELRVAAPMPGLVVAVQVSPGSEIVEGTAVIIMEAMKMQMEIRAPRAGRVSAISVQPNQEVAKGQTLFTITSPPLSSIG